MYMVVQFKIQFYIQSVFLKSHACVIFIILKEKTLLFQAQTLQKCS